MRAEILGVWVLLLVIAGPGAIAQEEVRQLNIIDQRPPGERRAWRTFTNSPFSCVFGVRRVSEAVGYGDRLRALREDLSAELNPSIHEISVTRYDVFLNRAAAIRAFATGVAISAHGVGGSVEVRQAPRCAREEMPVGWFDPAELTNANSPLIIEIDAIANGQSFAVRSVYSPSLELDDIHALPFQGRRMLHEPEEEAAFREAMAKAHDVLAANINAVLAPAEEGSAPIADPSILAPATPTP